MMRLKGKDVFLEGGHHHSSTQDPFATGGRQEDQDKERGCPKEILNDLSF